MELSLISMGWFKGKSTGKNVFPHQIWGFPLDFPLNQSNDYKPPSDKGVPPMTIWKPPKKIEVTRLVNELSEWSS